MGKLWEKGGIIYIRDIDGHIYEGKILDINEQWQSYYVGYETDHLFKTVWRSFSGLEASCREAFRNGALLF